MAILSPLDVDSHVCAMVYHYLRRRSYLLGEGALTIICARCHLVMTLQSFLKQYNEICVLT